MSSVLSLETSRLIFEMIGEFEVEQHWVEFPSNEYGRLPEVHRGNQHELAGDMSYTGKKGKDWIPTPAPTFAELIRVLPKLQKKLKWDNTSESIYRDDMSKIYQEDEEPEAMKEVEKYLLTLLK